MTKIGRLLIAGVLATQPAQYIDATSMYSNTSNQYAQDDYVNGILETRKAYKTLEYSVARFGQNVNATARTETVITRYVAENTYLYNSYTLIDLYNGANLDIGSIYTTITINPINNEAVSSIDVYVYKFANLTQDQENFLQGQRYYSISEMEALYTKLEENEIYFNNMGQIQGTQDYALHITNPHYFAIEVIIDYDPQYVNDNGEFMENIRTFQEINYRLTYIPADPSGYEVVDIKGLMFEILGMPFAWISTAFNFTIFPNTPYALNLSHILMAIIMAFIVIFIIKRLLK